MSVGAGNDIVVVMYREDDRWQASLLPERLAEDVDALEAAVRQQPGDGPTIGLVDIADEFFVALRVDGGRCRYLLSDVTAAVAWDLASQVCQRLAMEVPGEDDLDDVWPAGDLGIFADLGVDEMELGAVLADLDAYADEQLLTLARRLGFADVYERVLEAAAR